MLWAVTRLTGCPGSAFIVESIIFGLADLHARVNDAVRVRDARPAIEDAPPMRSFPSGSCPGHCWTGVQQMAARMPNASIKVLEGYGHICLINRDFDLRSAIEPWLADRVF